jgi:hypothetical protein
MDAWHFVAVEAMADDRGLEDRIEDAWLGKVAPRLWRRARR